MFISKNKDIDISNIMKDIYGKDKIFRTLEFILGILVVSIAYNMFLLPSNIVYGVGGIGVILKKVYSLPPSGTILIFSLILLGISFLVLGKERTAHSVLGSILYPVFIKLTEFIPDYISLGNLEPIVIVVLGAVLQGIGLGLIFKAGYTTGGTDILNAIFSKIFKVSIGKSMIFTDGVIILIGLFIFNFPTFVYSIISLYIISMMTDKVILGISQSKTFYIITDNETTVKKFLIHTLSHGVTVLNGRGGYTGDNQKVIMCTIPTREYFIVKEGIKEIDPNAFFLVTDTYEVSGGA